MFLGSVLWSHWFTRAIPLPLFIVCLPSWIQIPLSSLKNYRSEDGIKSYLRLLQLAFHKFLNLLNLVKKKKKPRNFPWQFDLEKPMFLTSTSSLQPQPAGFLYSPVSFSPSPRWHLFSFMVWTAIYTQTSSSSSSARHLPVIQNAFSASHGYLKPIPVNCNYTLSAACHAQSLKSFVIFPLHNTFCIFSNPDHSLWHTQVSNHSTFTLLWFLTHPWP